MSETTERDLVINFAKCKVALKNASAHEKEAKKAFAKAESAILKLLEAKGAEATARYEGVGYVRAKKPELFASCDKEHEEKLFSYLEEQGRKDMIKQKVSGLSKYVSELIDSGGEVPEFITFYLKSSAQLYNK